jgi:hypothetical protein
LREINGYAVVFVISRSQLKEIAEIRTSVVRSSAARLSANMS